MKKLILLAVFTIVCCYAKATTIYEIKYSFANTADRIYAAFLVRYENNTGFMRVRYIVNGRAKVVNMDFEEIRGNYTIDGASNETIRFKGSNPVFILGEATDKYYPDYLWFKKLPGESTFKPWGVTSPDPNGATLQGTISNVRLLNTSDITEEYANYFFGKTEPFYVNLFHTAASTTASYASTGTIKLIMIANTNDDNIGTTCQRDIDHVKGMFRDVSRMLNLGFECKEISGDNFGKGTVVSTLNSLSTSNNDILVFCYSGHGFHYKNDEANAYPQFDLRRGKFDALDPNTLNLTEIYSMLKSQNAHLKIVLSDCCNSYLNVAKPFGNSRAATARSIVQWSKSNCQSLFLNQSGVVVATAASKGETAKCNSDIGGFFIYNFVKSLDKSLSVFEGNTSWSSIISETKSAVLQMTNGQNCNEALCSETAVSYVKIN
jgi:hypothetical protein